MNGIRARIVWKAALTAALLGLGAGRVGADTIVTATIDGGGNSTIGTLDLTTGQFTAQSDLPYLVLGMAYGPDGTLYQGALDGNLYAVPPSGTPTAIATAPYDQSFVGLATVGSDVYGLTNVTDAPIFAPNLINRFSAGGRQLDSEQLNPPANGMSSGALALGPDGSFYASFRITRDYGNGIFAPGPDELFRLDRATGGATPIGTGLGAANDDELSLVTAGGVLYGIDTWAASGLTPIAIYTIDTSTGQATPTGVNVTGLPDGYTVDAMAAVPEPGSMVLLPTGLLVALAAHRRHRFIARRSGVGSGGNLPARSSLDSGRSQGDLEP